MKVVISIAFMLFAYSLTTDAGWFRRRRNRIRLPTYNPSHSKNGYPHFNKRSDDLKEQTVYNVSLQADPCNFMTYDLDKNGEVILGEFYVIFGESEMALNLFGDLDADETGALEEDEFYEQASTFINACADLAADDE